MNLQSLYASQHFYIVSIGLSKVSTALFIVHLSYSGPRIKPAYILAAVSVAWTVVSMFVIAFRGDISRPWATLDGTHAMVSLALAPTARMFLGSNVPQYGRWIGVEVAGLLLEAALWVLSINLVWGLQMTLRKRLIIVGAFGFRLLYVPF
jgi:hypothetical protein